MGHLYNTYWAFTDFLSYSITISYCSIIVHIAEASAMADMLGVNAVTDNQLLSHTLSYSQ